jgi:hypothetical protein
MIGRCFRCGIWGEVDITPLSGGSRILCSACSAVAGMRADLPLSAPRLRALYDEFRHGTIGDRDLLELRGGLEFLLTEARRNGDAGRISEAEVVIEEVEAGRFAEGRRRAPMDPRPSPSSGLSL